MSTHKHIGRVASSAGRDRGTEQSSNLASSSDGYVANFPFQQERKATSGQLQASLIKRQYDTI